MNFGQAIESLKAGYHVARSGWNGKGMYLVLAVGGTFTTGFYDHWAGDLQPHIVMKTAQHTFVPWLASQTDILAEDWLVL